MSLWAEVRGEEAEADSRSQRDLRVGSTSSEQSRRANWESGDARGCVAEKSLWFLGLISVRLEAGKPGRRLEEAVF